MAQQSQQSQPAQQGFRGIRLTGDMLSAIDNQTAHNAAYRFERDGERSSERDGEGNSAHAEVNDVRGSAQSSSNRPVQRRRIVIPSKLEPVYHVTAISDELKLCNSSSTAQFCKTKNTLGIWEFIGSRNCYGLNYGVFWEYGSENMIIYTNFVKILVTFNGEDNYIDVETLEFEATNGISMKIEYSMDDSGSITIWRRGELPVYTYSDKEIFIQGLPSIGVNKIKIDTALLRDYPNFKTDQKLPVSADNIAFKHFQDAYARMDIRWYFDLIIEANKPAIITPQLNLDVSEDVAAVESIPPNIVCKVCLVNIAKFMMPTCGHFYCCIRCYTLAIEAHQPLNFCVVCRKEGLDARRVYT